MGFLKGYLPILDWLPGYTKEHFSGDLNAGTVTAIMLVPQAMAYAMLAGLPPQIGLYASVFPLILYAAFGSSRVLGVGPVALVSLMVASTLNSLGNTHDTQAMVETAGVLALMVGVMSTVMGLLKLGFVVNFVSHHVISGFTSAAALIIGLSQLKYLMGVDLPRTHNIITILQEAWNRLASVNGVALTIGLSAIAVMLFFTKVLDRLLLPTAVRPGLRRTIVRLGPLVVVVVSTAVVYAFGLQGTHGVEIVGAIPQGLPHLTVPNFDMDQLEVLMPSAVLITIVGFIESVSVAKALASRRRQKIIPDQELVGLGVANIGSAVSGGYPVTGGFSRTSVNFHAGAHTPISSVITAVLVLLTVLYFTPLLYHLPKAVLASIIMVAVFSLVDIKAPIHAWTYSRADALSLIGTFVSVVALGIEVGLAIGVGITVVLYLWRTSKPHVAIIGRVPGTEHFRNFLRYDVQREKDVTIARIDESLFFANAAWLEDWALGLIADKPDVKHLILNCAAVNFIDGSALEVIERLEEELFTANVTLHLCEVKGLVIDRLKKSELYEHLGERRIHLSTHAAMVKLGYVS